jgi:hypothetical protein
MIQLEDVTKIYRMGKVEPPRVWYRPYFVCDAAGVAASVAA